MEIVQFLRDNWQFISTGLVLLFTIILAIIKKRPVTELIDNNAYKDLITLVNEAESKFGSGHGPEKLEFVITSYCSLKGMNQDPFIFGSVKALVERLLSTPQKKEDK